MKLLIVDDHEINLKLLRAQLEAEGHDVLQAADGVEALEILATDAVDGVISDILMPRMDGYRLCMEIRQHPGLADLPFILYTSTYNSPSDRKLAESLGADAYLAKPAPLRLLMDALARARGGSRPRASVAPGSASPTPVMKQYNEALIRKLEEKGLELERTHEGLLESKARLAGLIESAMDAIIVADDQYVVVLFNEAAGAMFGCDPQLAIGRALHDFIPMHSGSESHLHLRAFARDGGQGRTMGRQVLGLRSDGTEFPIEASISRLSTSRSEGFTLFIRDITERLRAQNALAESAAGLRRAQDLAQLSHAVVNAQGAIESSSDSFGRLLGLAGDEVPSDLDQWLQLVHPEDRARATAMAAEARNGARRIDFEYRVRSGDGWRNIKHIMEPLLEAAGDPATLRTFNTMQDITTQKETEKRMLGLNRVYAVLSGINSLIVRTQSREDLFQQSCRIVVETGGFTKAWIGLTDPDCAPVRIVGSAGADPAFFSRLQERLVQIGPGGGILDRVLSGRQPVVCNDIANDARVLERDNLVGSGSLALALLPLVVDDETIGVVSLHSPVVGFFDEAEMRLLRELAGDISFALDHLIQAERIHYLGRHDSLTGLPNRVSFAGSVAGHLGDGESAAAGPTVVMVDLIRFRRVNETFGRAVGDALLRSVATRLHAVDRFVARTGPDVFALLVHGPGSAPELAREFEQLSERVFAKPFVIEGHEIRIGCRIGAAVFPADGLEAEALLLNAEEALRRAKASGSAFVFYAPEMNANAARSFAFESELRRAIEREEFVLHYQPKVRLADGRICGAEALIRWQHPEKGLVPPDAFISVLEETGLIRAVGMWAVERALADRAIWVEQGLLPVRVSVNVSPMQLDHPGFVAQVAAAVERHQEGALEMEITESVIMDDVERKIAMLDQLRNLHVAVAVDDFGTGYSSLSYIAKLPASSLKIDRAFVAGMANRPHGLVMVSSIIALAHALGLNVVAEGVETREQASQLLSLDCDEAQGYLFSPAVPAEDFAALLAKPVASASAWGNLRRS